MNQSSHLTQVLARAQEKKRTSLSLSDLRRIVAYFLQHSPDASKFWDLVTALRGPDFPSECEGMSSSDYAKAYDGRRKRKAKTVEVIRHHAFFGATGGSARVRSDRNYVVVNKQQDHFDRHVVRAAQVLGLDVRYEG